MKRYNIMALGQDKLVDTIVCDGKITSEGIYCFYKYDKNSKRKYFYWVSTRMVYVELLNPALD